MSLLSGRWRLFVLLRLAEGDRRWAGLRRSLPPQDGRRISHKMLAQTLRALEADGLVWRHATAGNRPEVTYGLTEAGRGLAPVFDALAAWREPALAGTDAA